MFECNKADFFLPSGCNQHDGDVLRADGKSLPQR